MDVEALGPLLLQDAWRRGIASRCILDTSGPTGGQQAWVRMLDAIPPGGWAALEVSRQRGKTFTTLVWMFQHLGLRPERGVFLAQTGANSYKIVEQFIRDVGSHLPPEWDVRMVGDEVRFANGSELAVFGTDNGQFRRSRGRNAHRVILSEAGFYSSLEEVESVYTKQLQTTGGVGVYESSPAESPTHTFARRCDAAQAVGRYVRDTFWSNPRVDHEGIILGEMQRLGLTREQLFASTEFRRELLAERVTEETRAALPSWTPEARAELVREWPRPMHFDAYAAIDTGRWGDPHAALFAVHDPSSNTVTVEAELELASVRTDTDQFATALKSVESSLWGVSRWDGTLLGVRHEDLARLPEFAAWWISEAAPRQPYLRVSDPDPRVQMDFQSRHGMAVVPSEKHDKALWVDFVNQLVRERRLRVLPSCVRLLEQMSSTLWNRTRSEWERTDRDHGDLIDCLVYLLRNVRWNRDCRPPTTQQRWLNVENRGAGWEDAFR